MDPMFVKGLIDQDLMAIKMADDKAWICIAVTIAIFAGVARVMYQEAKERWLLVCVGYASLALMAGSVTVSVYATFAQGRTRITKTQQAGITYFRRVAAFEFENHYFEHVKTATADRIRDEEWKVHWALSKMASDKYCWLEISFVASILGWLSSAAYLTCILVAARKAAATESDAHSSKLKEKILRVTSPTELTVSEESRNVSDGHIEKLSPS